MPKYANMDEDRGTLKKQHSSFEDPLTVHPWDRLINQLCQEFSVEDSEFDNFLRSSKTRIGDDNYNKIQLLDGRTLQKYHAFFDCLEDIFGQDGAVEFLKNLTATLNFHGDSGRDEYTRVFQQYQQDSSEFHKQLTAKGLELDPNFVGRAELTTKIVEILQKDPPENAPSFEKHPKGVVFCGLPGMGKTSLASQICYILLFDSTRRWNIVRKWNIIIVNQRGKTEVEELLSDVIECISKEIDTTDNFWASFSSLNDQKQKLISLLQDLAKRKEHHLILLDNMDGHFRHDYSMCEQILTEALDTIAHMNNIKLLMTVCKSLSESNAADSFGGNPVLKGHIMEFKLTGLSFEDAEKIISKMSWRLDEHQLEKGLCQQAFVACDGNPLAIKALSVLLRDPRNDDFVRSSFKTGQLFSVMSCLKETFAKMIPEGLQRFIARLSVFNTNWFAVKDAQHVSASVPDVPQRQSVDTVEKLHTAQAYHMLERDFFSVLSRRQSCKQEERFAFHSIVAEFLEQTLKDSPSFKQEYIDGRKAFLSYFCKRIEKRGRKMNARTPLDIKMHMEELKPHLSLFFKLVIEGKESLSSLLDKAKEPSTIRCSYIWDVSEFTNAQYLQLTFTQRQAQHAENSKELMQYIYWKSTEATCLMKSDKLKVALESMDKINGQFKITDDGQLAYSAEGWNVSKADEKFAFCTFNKVYGTIYLRMGTKENNKDKLKIALVKFDKAINIIHEERSKKLKKIIDSDTAEIQNRRGCVYFSTGDLTNALECHKAAKASDCSRPSFISQRVEYAANIAACYHQMGLNTKNQNERMKHLNDALMEYNNCISFNKDIGMENSTTSLTILRNRAEVFYVKGELERAQTDGKHALRIARKLFVPPHVELTMAIERAALYHFKLGKRLRDEDEQIGEGTKLMDMGLELYDEMLYQICQGGLLPFENNDDRVIFTELEELIKNRLEPVQPNVSTSAYVEAFQCIKCGDSSKCVGPDKVAYQHLIEWLRNRRLQLPTNKQYRNAKDNHIKLMEKLRYSKKQIDKIKHRYQEFELGKFNKLISQNQSFVPDHEEQQRIRQAIAEGADFFCSLSSSEDIDTTIDTHYDMALSRQRKDSGVCDEFISTEVEPTDDELDIRMQQEEQVFEENKGIGIGTFDNPDFKVSVSESKEYTNPKIDDKIHRLRRHSSIDGSHAVSKDIIAEGDVKFRNPSTSRSSRSSLGSLKRKSSSLSSSGSFSDKWRMGSSFSSQTSQSENSFDNEIVEQAEEEVLTNECDQKRQLWANSGKQQSVASELWKLQVTDDDDEPLPKQLKFQESDDKGTITEDEKIGLI